MIWRRLRAKLPGHFWLSTSPRLWTGLPIYVRMFPRKGHYWAIIPREHGSLKRKVRGFCGEIIWNRKIYRFGFMPRTTAA